MKIALTNKSLGPHTYRLAARSDLLPTSRRGTLKIKTERTERKSETKRVSFIVRESPEHPAQRVSRERESVCVCVERVLRDGEK